MAKSNHIELGDGTTIPILYEDRTVLALDKPPGWMLVPYSWQKTNRNLQAAIVSAIAERHFWSRSRNIKFLRYVHRLDAETSGVLLFGKSPGAVEAISELFESRKMQKVYLAAVDGVPSQKEWISRHKLGQDPREIGRMKVDERSGKDAETHFKLLETVARCSLIEARPITGRTHQIRLHLAADGYPVLGDPLYATGGKPAPPPPKRGEPPPLGLRAVSLSYPDPFTRQTVHIRAPAEDFIKDFGFRIAV